MIKPLPPRSLVRKLLRYAPPRLIWKRRLGQPQWNARWAGKIAGCIHPDGHIYVCISDGDEHTTNHKAHRLVWLIVRGGPVPDLIDHIDGDRGNNRIGNLRAATNPQSAYNRKVRIDSGTGIKGVSYLTRDDRFRVTINSRQIGTFKTLEEAVTVRREAAKRLHGRFMNETTI